MRLPAPGARIRICFHTQAAAEPDLKPQHVPVLSCFMNKLGVKIAISLYKIIRNTKLSYRYCFSQQQHTVYLIMSERQLRTKGEKTQDSLQQQSYFHKEI